MVLHDDDHRLGFAGREQVVHDGVHAALDDPTPFILSPAVMQIQDRITFRRVRIVIGRRVDEAAAPGAGDGGEIPPLAHLTVGHVFDFVVVGARFRDFDAAALVVAAEECLAGGVVHLDPIDHQRIVVEPDHQRRRGDAPDAILRLGHVIGFADTNLHLVGVGRPQLEGHAPVGMDLGRLRHRQAGRGNPDTHQHFHSRVLYRKSLGANSLRSLRQVSHSCDVPGDS